MWDGRVKPGSKSCQRDPLEKPAPMPMAPPILMQVFEPSIGTNPAPYAAHGLADARPFKGSALSDFVAVLAFG